jgi:hypothetical protein
MSSGVYASNRESRWATNGVSRDVRELDSPHVRAGRGGDGMKREVRTRDIPLNWEWEHGSAMRRPPQLGHEPQRVQVRS